MLGSALALSATAWLFRHQLPDLESVRATVDAASETIAALGNAR